MQSTPEFRENSRPKPKPGSLPRVTKPQNRGENPPWPVPGAFLAQKKIAAKLETAVTPETEQKPSKPRESRRSFVYRNISGLEPQFHLFLPKPWVICW